MIYDMTESLDPIKKASPPKPETDAVKSDAKEPDTETVTKDEGLRAAVEASRENIDPQPRPRKSKNSVSPGATAVVGNADTDEVFLSKLEYRAYARKSLSVHHLQRRLNDLGYTEAYADRDGWYGDLTHDAVARFQIDHNLQASGLVDAETAQAIFDGDPNVTLVLS